MRPSRSGAWTLLRSGIPIGAAATLWVVLLKVDVLMLAFLTNNQEVGLYAAASRLVEGTMFVAWAFNAAMLPWVAELPVLPEKRGNARGGKGERRANCSAREPRLHQRQTYPCTRNSPN